VGGQTRTNAHISSLAELPRHGAALLDLTPRQILQIQETELPRSYRRRLARYRYGPGVFKIDWALEAPIPWQAEACRAAGTVHLGGTLAEVASAEAAVRCLAALPGERKLALLGLMAELGDQSESEHRRIALVAQQLGIDVVGYETGLYGEAYVTGVDEAVALLGTIGPGDAALVKGSRGVRLKGGAGIELDDAVPSADGFEVVNPADGTRYQIAPTALTIVTPDGEVFSEPMIQHASS